MKGKRIAVGDRNSGVEVNARNLLEGHDITYDDIKVDYLGYAEATDGLKARQIDAAFLTSGLPNASLLELSETLDIKLVTIEPEDVERIAQEYFISMEIPKDTYGNDKLVPTAAIMNTLVANADMSEDDVYKLTKTFFENLNKLSETYFKIFDAGMPSYGEAVDSGDEYVLMKIDRPMKEINLVVSKNVQTSIETKNGETIST